MKAVVVRQFGDEAYLKVEDVQTPEPRGGEVQIDVSHAGVGFVDTLMRSGAFDFIKLPFTPGIEVAGHVSALGTGVSGFSIGQPVAALLTDFTDGGMGGYAEKVCAKAALTLPLFSTDDPALAAATVVNGATAFMAAEAVQPGMRVAISGASGGLGLSLISAASIAGAREIIAITGRPAQKAGLLAAGASHVLTPSELSEVGEFDVSFDSVGGKVRVDLLNALKRGGKLIILGNASGENLALSGDAIWLKHIKVEGISTGGISHINPQRIVKAARLALDSARLATAHLEVLPMEQVATAHRALENRLGRGKFVLAIRAASNAPEKVRTDVESIVATRANAESRDAN